MTPLGYLKKIYIWPKNKRSGTLDERNIYQESENKFSFWLIKITCIGTWSPAV
jgi:hypothetical protein